jgi:hypothetical protein
MVIERSDKGRSPGVVEAQVGVRALEDTALPDVDRPCGKRHGDVADGGIERGWPGHGVMNLRRGQGAPHVVGDVAPPHRSREPGELCGPAHAAGVTTADQRTHCHSGPIISRLNAQRCEVPLLKGSPTHSCPGPRGLRRCWCAAGASHHLSYHPPHAPSLLEAFAVCERVPFPCRWRLAMDAGRARNH